jgi:DNA-binding response OmpR family regulator
MERVQHRILLIENLETMGRMIALYLLSSGYELATTSDPEAVEPRLVTDPPDLIVFNTGMEAAMKSSYISRWREAVPSLRILEISPNPYIWKGNIAPQDIGAPDRFLNIPFDLDGLGSAVEQCLSTPSDESGPAKP